VLVYWFPMLVAWVIKASMSRFFGAKAYTGGRPFFEGLIIGEFLQAFIWAVLSTVWRLKPPYFPYN
jgi:hypothetical protein